MHAELRAAEQMLADPEFEPWVGAVHLQRAWRLLFDHDGHGEFEPWVAAHVRAEADVVTHAALLRAGSFVCGDHERPVPDRETLLEHAAVLRSRIDAPGEPASRVPLRFALIAFCGLALAMAGSVIYSFVRGPQGPWIGQYFETPDFQGPWRRWDARRIEFDWGKKSPLDGMPEDNFSAVFRTCLVLEEDTDVRFRLSSDDGSRLLVDGQLIVDNWGAHPTLTRTGKTMLPAGVHELRIDYFEAILSANLKLEVALGKEAKYESLSPMLLRRPAFRKARACS